MTTYEDKIDQFLNNGGEIKKIPFGARTIKNKETGENEIIIEKEQKEATIKPSTQTAKIYSLSDGAQFFSEFKVKKKKKIDLSNVKISDLPEELKQSALEISNATKKDS